MSHQHVGEAQDSEHMPRTAVALQSGWKSAWLNNKGVFLIILAQATGSTMDAIVRFLQQGGHGMHPFQVRKGSHY
jgi:hypothetical protein